MKSWIIVIATAVVLATGFLVLIAFLFISHDLRGWTPNTYRDPERDPFALVEATLPGARSFSIADCLPGTISPYDGPSSEEYSGEESVTVLTCRSKSSATTFILAYIALTLAVMGLTIFRAKRRRGAKG